MSSDEHIHHIPLGGTYPTADCAAHDDIRVAAPPGSSATALASGVLSGRGREVPGQLAYTADPACYPATLSVGIEMSDYDDGQEPSGVKISIHVHGGTGTEAAQLAADAYRELTGLLGTADPSDSD